MEADKCSVCSTKLIFAENETYCPKCGLVVDDAPMDSSDGNINEQRTGKRSKFVDGDMTKTLPTDIGK